MEGGDALKGTHAQRARTAAFSSPKSITQPSGPREALFSDTLRE